MLGESFGFQAEGLIRDFITHDSLATTLVERKTRRSLVDTVLLADGPEEVAALRCQSIDPPETDRALDATVC
jgi:hypothetical protein